MKVLFCTNAFEKVSNGPAKFAHLLLEGAENTGFEIRILTEDISVEILPVYKLELNIPKWFRALGQFIRMWKYHKAAMRIRKDFEFDILVYNNAIIGLLSSVRFKRTVGMINDYTNADNSLPAVFKKNAAFNKRVLFHYVEYITCRMSRCIIVNSEYLKKRLSERYHCRESLFKVLHKGIEPYLIALDRTDILKKKNKGSILFVKTDFSLGGLYTLIGALKGIKDEITLTIIGPAPQHHSMLKKILEDDQIPYQLFEYMPPGKVYEKMKSSEIFCVPSKREAFGVANIEAMALGCKIVSTNVGGIPEAVGGGRFAWLAPPDDLVALKKALILALNTSIENKVNDIDDYLNDFSSVKVVSGFKTILEAYC